LVQIQPLCASVVVHSKVEYLIIHPIHVFAMLLESYLFPPMMMLIMSMLSEQGGLCCCLMKTFSVQRLTHFQAARLNKLMKTCIETKTGYESLG